MLLGGWLSHRPKHRTKQYVGFGDNYRQFTFARNSVKLCYIPASTSYNSRAKNWHDFTLTTLGRKVLDWSGFEWNASLPDFDGAKLPSCMKPFDRDNVASFFIILIQYTINISYSTHEAYIYIHIKNTHTLTPSKTKKRNRYIWHF